MANHVSISEVYANKLVLATGKGGRCLDTNLASTHCGVAEDRLVGLRLDFLIQLHRRIEVARSVAVPEVSHVTNLVALRAGVLGHASAEEVLGHDIFNDGVRGQRLGRDSLLVVIDQQTVVVSGGHRFSVKGSCVKLGTLFESSRDFNRTVATEIEANDNVLVNHAANGLVVSTDNHPGRVVLIGFLGEHLSGRQNGLCGGMELASPALSALLNDSRVELAVNHGVPSALYDVPVRLVPVQGDIHASATTGKTVVKSGLRVDGRKCRLDLVNVLQSRERENIATVSQSMETNFANTAGRQVVNQFDHLVHVRVNIAVRQKANEVYSSGRIGVCLGNDAIEVLGAKQRSVLNRNVDQLGTLGH